MKINIYMFTQNKITREEKMEKAKSKKPQRKKKKEKRKKRKYTKELNIFHKIQNKC